MRLSSTLTPAVLSLLVPGSLALSVNLQSRATTCNGSPDLCNRSYGNITFVGAHDSYAVGINNLAANQDYNVTQQLTDGIRLLQVQAHNLSSDIQLCHTSCDLLNGGTLDNYLSQVKTWMDGNPNDVVTMLIVNSDNLDPSLFDQVYKSAGVDTLSYNPPAASMPATGWPTLGTLIDAGTRLVTFLSTTANFAEVPYLIDEFSNVFETPFDVTTTFDCSVNRTSGDPTTQMFLINHFLDQVILGFAAPFVEEANATNAVSGSNSLGEQVQLCVSDYNRSPNFMLVDFYEYGNGSVFQVAASANGVSYNPTTPIATPIPQGSQTSSASGSAGTVSTTSTSIGFALSVIIGAMSIS
ncbi:uncharacterized protein PHACADRAFT_247911 [Phanerochaete carnosa HHB-10118-sp]|uniref:PLC-like phosphodiesterase n=1 Tax=Phanerochaete carnosa (strain HHB-10118-sp) TaxID=650164 RepID=K5VEF1_PHACS|nr:uncharacterized protein PHACADRAFT_247911 [Phanerochaete carnosa HHB-10118-sp]EKM61361.1 hypothetical protein PHACADRAFT_247911 [Phanerochaete carnosa HHB-10118-sp]